MYMYTVHNDMVVNKDIHDLYIVHACRSSSLLYALVWSELRRDAEVLKVVM